MVCYVTIWYATVWYVMLGCALFGGVMLCSVLWGTWGSGGRGLQSRRVGAGGGTFGALRGTWGSSGRGMQGRRVGKSVLET